MAGDNRIDLLELLRKAGHDGDIDFLAEAVRVMAQVLMELDVRQKVGAAPYERSAARQTYRNGYRTRLWDTRVGRIELRIPKLRQGSYFPAILEPRRRAEQALVSVIQEAYVHGVSTRKVDELVQAMGLEGVSKSEVSRLCAELDQMVEAFRNRPLGCFPYVWLDATYLKVREDGRVQSMALVVATGVKDTGEREVLGLDVGPSEDGAFWMAFLRGLLARGLKGVKLVISDAHEGLKAAIDAVLQGASWQRCRVHFMRNILAQVPKSAQPMVAAAVRTIFTQATQDEARAQLRHVADTLEARFPKLARLLLDAEDEVLAYMVFPERHWRQIHSTNPLERLHKEIKRRAHVVGIFPNRASVLRLMGAVLMEQNDEWATGRRYFSAESMAEIGRREVNAFIATAAN
ncbi:MAG: IS256 family transposase [Clostridia bacterium]|nr:IS256 family transposase [Clostridia bacterium]